MLVGPGHNEDAAVILPQPGKALVQSVDFLCPVVNDPFRFGQIAAANSLSDIYAMGGVPLSALNLLCFPFCTLDKRHAKAILDGGLSILNEAGCLLLGGHSVDDPIIKFGLSVTGLVDPHRILKNGAVCPGDYLVLTKALGTGILATALKARWPGSETAEDVIWRTCARLNRDAAQAASRMGLLAATDITGFGLAGHLLEMAEASGVHLRLDASAIPLLPQVADLSRQGLVPAGTHANRLYYGSRTRMDPSVPPHVADAVFDAQTSGGLVIAAAPAAVAELCARLTDAGDLAAVIGQAFEPGPDSLPLTLRA